MFSEKKMNNLFIFLSYLAIYAGLYQLNNVWLVMISYHLLLLIAIRLNTRKFSIKYIFHGFNLNTAILLCIPAVLSGLLLIILWPLIKLECINFADKINGLGIHSKLWCIFIPYYILVTPWLEEYFWRGIVGSDKKFPDFSDLLFAGYHILVLAMFIKYFWVILIFIILVLSAWMWRLTKIKYNGLFIPIMAHFLADISTVFAMYKITF